MSRDEFDSSSALYECKLFSKIYFGETLSFIGESVNLLAGHVSWLVSI